MIVIFVSFSRVYLGAHFISDVVVGCAVGAMLLLLYLAIEDRMLSWLAARSFAQQISTCVVAVIALVGIGIVIFSITAQVDDPTRWVEYPSTRLSAKSLGIYTGAILGLGIGLSMAALWARFDAGGPIRIRLVRVLLLAGPAALYWLRPKDLFKDMYDPLLFALSFAGCGLAAWASVFLVPWLFLRFGLAEKRPS